jgi:glycosyltransferase involved in cell wall biosynthesis
MRICVIGNPNSIHIQRWLRYFVQRGHEMHLIGDVPLKVALPDGITFYDLPRQINRRKLRYAVWIWTTRRLVRRIQPDVLHAHRVASAGWLGAASGFHPFVVTSWGSDLLVSAKRSSNQRQLARWVLHRADYVTCVSELLAQAALELGADPQRVEVAFWGVDTEIFHPAPPSAPDVGAPLVLSIRAMRPIYDPLVIARAIPKVLARIPEATFAIRTYSVDDSLLTEFRTLVEEAGASSSVEYIGDLPGDQAIAELYRRAAVVVSVPLSDGTPQSVLEAMACGSVPVVSDLPSLRLWVQHEREALLAPVGDADAVADAIGRLLANRELHGRMRTAGLQMIGERADSSTLMAHYTALYRRLAEATPRSDRGKR